MKTTTSNSSVELRYVDLARLTPGLSLELEALAILSTATPLRDAYRVTTPPIDDGSGPYPLGTLRLRSLGGCFAQGDGVFVILSE